jgi:hypothetical protein
MLMYRPSKAWRQFFGQEDANGAQYIQISERTSEISSLALLRDSPGRKSASSRNPEGCCIALTMQLARLLVK